jgi:hypothetical protein
MQFDGWGMECDKTTSNWDEVRESSEDVAFFASQI